MRTNFNKRKNSTKRNIDIIVPGKSKINIFQPQVSATNPQYLQLLPRCLLTYVSFSLKKKKILFISISCFSAWRCIENEKGVQIIFIFTLSALTKNNVLLAACFNRWWLVLAEKGVINIDPAILTYVQLLLVKGNKD